MIRSAQAAEPAGPFGTAGHETPSPAVPNGRVTAEAPT